MWFLGRTAQSVQFTKDDHKRHKEDHKKHKDNLLPDARRLAVLEGSFCAFVVFFVPFVISRVVRS